MSSTPESSIRVAARPGVPAPPIRTKQHTLMSADVLLQVSRRVDWRFLLPDPTLEQVAYIGQPVGTLLSALELFSTQVRVFEPAAVGSAITTTKRNGSHDKYDVVVTCDPTSLSIKQAVALVRPGGYLYMEIHGPLKSIVRSLSTGFRGGGARPKPGRPHDYVVAIKQLGLRKVECYWFWPSFEACTKIIPLQERIALLHALAPSGVADSVLLRLQTHWRRWVVEKLSISRALEFVIPCFGIVAQ